MLDIDRVPYIQRTSERAPRVSHWRWLMIDGVGGKVNPVYPMRFRKSTSCFSMKGSNDWWGGESKQSRKSNALQRSPPVLFAERGE